MVPDFESFPDIKKLGNAALYITQKIPGSRIVKEYNLIDRDLAWHPDISRTPRFSDFVREVKEDFKNL